MVLLKNLGGCAANRGSSRKTLGQACLLRRPLPLLQGPIPGVCADDAQLHPHLHKHQGRLAGGHCRALLRPRQLPAGRGTPGFGTPLCQAREEQAMTAFCQNCACCQVWAVGLCQVRFVNVTKLATLHSNVTHVVDPLMVANHTLRIVDRDGEAVTK